MSRAKAAPGPPAATPGDDHRVYVGAVPLAVSIASVDLYFNKRIVFGLVDKKKKPAVDDLWLVSREGDLYRMTALAPIQRGTLVCAVERA